MGLVKTLDELRIDSDILIIGIDNLSKSDDKLKAISHLEESIKYLKDGMRKRSQEGSDVSSRALVDNEYEDDVFSTENNLKDEHQHPDTTFLSPMKPLYSITTQDSTTPTPTIEQKVTKNINCPYCAFRTLSVHSFRAHMSRHTSQIKCDLCDTYFARACNLKRHNKGTLHKQKVRELHLAQRSESSPDAQDLSSSLSKGSHFDFETEEKIIGIKRIKRASVIVPVPRTSLSNSPSDKVSEADEKCLNIVHNLVSQSKRSPLKSGRSSDDINDDGSGTMRNCVNFEARVDICRLRGTFTKGSNENNLNMNESCPKLEEKIHVADKVGSDVTISEPSSKVQASFSCHICFKSYSKKEYLSQHMVEHTTRYQCGNCLQTFSNRRRLNNHKKRPENCARLLQIRDKSLQKLSKPGSGRMDVDDASNSFLDSPQKDDLVIDVMGEAEVEEPSLICQQCGAQVSSIEEMKLHLSLFHEVEIFDKHLVANQEGDKQDNEKINYDQDLKEVDMFQCEICDKLFSSRQSLRNHQVSHTDRFKCGSCHYGFSSKKIMEQHTRNPDNCDRLRKKRKRLDDSNMYMDARSFVVAVLNDQNE